MRHSGRADSTEEDGVPGLTLTQAHSMMIPLYYAKNYMSTKAIKSEHWKGELK